MGYEEQQNFIDYIVEKVEDDLDKISDGRTEKAALTVRMPYGAIDETKLLIADWLVTNFPNCVTCISNKERCFTKLDKNNLIPANIYNVDLDKYVL